MGCEGDGNTNLLVVYVEQSPKAWEVTGGTTERKNNRDYQDHRTVKLSLDI